MSIPTAVLDTNIVVAGLRSRAGASFRLLSLLPRRCFQPVISVPLILEYEDACKRLVTSNGPLSFEDIDVVLDNFCAFAHHQKVFFLWRPQLRDCKDDMVLELAVAARCRTLVTFNVRDFRGAERFGVEIVQPAHFLQSLGVSS